MVKNIAVLYNPMAGKGKAVKIASRIIDILESKQIAFSRFGESWPSQFENYSDIFLVGGDGTLNYLINQYPDLRLPISLFKGGSGNDFAWKLYGSKTVDEYLELALNCEPKFVDAGVCNGRLFLNGVGIGFDGAIVKSMGERRFFSAGHLAYFFTVLKHILFYKEPYIETVSGNGHCAGRFFMLTIANGSRYGGGFLVAPDAELNDSFFDIISIKKIAPLLRLKYLPKVKNGSHFNLSFVSSFKSDYLHIYSKNLLPGHYDGEFLEALEFNISMLPAKFLFRY